MICQQQSKLNSECLQKVGKHARVMWSCTAVLLKVWYAYRWQYACHRLPVRGYFLGKRNNSKTLCHGRLPGYLTIFFYIFILVLYYYGFIVHLLTHVKSYCYPTNECDIMNSKTVNWIRMRRYGNTMIKKLPVRHIR